MLSSSDFSFPESRSMSIISAVKTLVIEPILKPVLAVGGPLLGSAQSKNYFYINIQPRQP